MKAPGVYSVLRNESDESGNIIASSVNIPSALMRDIMDAIERSGISYDDAVKYVPKWIEAALKSACQQVLSESQFRAPHGDSFYSHIYPAYGQFIQSGCIDC